MRSRLTCAILLLSTVLPAVQRAGPADRDTEIRDFIARWNAAYTSLDAAALEALETPDFEMIDRFGH